MKKCVSKFQPCVSNYYPYEITVPTLEEYEAQHNNTNGKSGKWTDDNTNTLLNNIGKVFSSWLEPADNTTYIIGGDNERGNNTMLYVGIGGVVLVVILFAVIALKK